MDWIFLSRRGIVFLLRSWWWWRSSELGIAREINQLRIKAVETAIYFMRTDTVRQSISTFTFHFLNINYMFKIYRGRSHIICSSDRIFPSQSMLAHYGHRSLTRAKICRATDRNDIEAPVGEDMTSLSAKENPHFAL